MGQVAAGAGRSWEDALQDAQAAAAAAGVGGELGLAGGEAVAEVVGDDEARAREVGGGDRDAGRRGGGAGEAGEGLLDAAVLERVKGDDADLL